MKGDPWAADDGDVMVGSRRRSKESIEPPEPHEVSNLTLRVFHGFLLVVFIAGGWIMLATLTGQSPSADSSAGSSVNGADGALGVPSPTTPTVSPPQATGLPREITIFAAP